MQVHQLLHMQCVQSYPTSLPGVQAIHSRIQLLDLMTHLHITESSRTQSDVKKEELASVCLLSGRKGEGRKEERNKSMNGWMKSEPMMREGVSVSG